MEYLSYYAASNRMTPSYELQNILSNCNIMPQIMTYEKGGESLSHDNQFAGRRSNLASPNKKQTGKTDHHFRMEQAQSGSYGMKGSGIVFDELFSSTREFLTTKYLVSWLTNHRLG
jgi:hypothetical protein